MSGEALPLPVESPPPPPSVGATIPPRASVKKPIASSVYDVSDAGVSGILFTYPRTRKTGKKVTDPITGEEVDEYEAYETLHQIQVIPEDVAQSADWVPASKAELKMITRKHAAEVDEDGKVTKEAWEEQVPYERPIPAKKIVHYTDWDTEYEYHPKMLKETIIVKKPVLRIRYYQALSKMKLKKIGGTGSWRLETDTGEDLGAVLGQLVGEDAKGKPLDLHYYVEAQGTIFIIITDPTEYEYPIKIDPSFTFDGTDFVIASAQTEIKTYQQLWGIYSDHGTNVRFNGGYCAIDSSGVQVNVGLDKSFSPTLDLSAMTDFTISIRTTNADAGWVLRVYMLDDGGSFGTYKLYNKNLANDVTATYTLSDFVASEVGTVDMSAINYIMIQFVGVDSGMVGNVTCEIKDFFTTSPVKTSDMYDSTRRFVLYSEDYEGDDGLAADSYNTGFGVTIGGTSVIEIDDAQANTGNTSLLLHRDAANDPTVYDNNPGQTGGVTRYTNHVYISSSYGNGSISYTPYIYNAANILVGVELRQGGGVPFFRLYYGDGIGGNNVIDINVSASAWHQIEIDIDLDNDICRYWIDGVLHPGPNADAGGWDNLTSDNADGVFTRVRHTVDAGATDIWIDDSKFYAGFEDFSALTAPHDIDDISEAVSPAGTDYGRGTWDGDWSGDGTESVDNTTVVIGTNSIKTANLTTTSRLFYWLDASIDVSSFTHLRMYVKTTEAGGYAASARDDGGAWLESSAFTLVADKWQYIDIPFTDWSTEPDWTILLRFGIRNLSGSTADVHIDGLHFYGDEDAGVEWQENSLDIDANAFDQDGIDFFNLNKIKDTTGGGTFVGDAGIEFADVANSGIDTATFDGTLTLTGTDTDNRVLWNAVGNTNPTNEWVADPKDNATITLTYVTWKYPNYPNFTINTITFYDFWVDYAKVLLFFGTGTYNRLEKIKVTNGQHATITFACNAAVTFREADIDGTKANNVQCNAAVSILFLDSKFNQDYIAILNADGMIVSKHHNKNKWSYILATGANGQAFSDLETDYPGHLPTPNDDFHTALGQLTCGTDGQKNVVYHLSSAAGTVIIISCEAGLVVLDPDLSDVLGTLTETFPLQRGMSTHLPLRPINLPLARPITVSDT